MRTDSYEQLTLFGTEPFRAAYKAEAISRLESFWSELKKVLTDMHIRHHTPHLIGDMLKEANASGLFGPLYLGIPVVLKQTNKIPNYDALKHIFIEPLAIFEGYSHILRATLLNGQSAHIDYDVIFPETRQFLQFGAEHTNTYLQSRSKSAREAVDALNTFCENKKVPLEWVEVLSTLNVCVFSKNEEFIIGMYKVHNWDFEKEKLYKTIIAKKGKLRTRESPSEKKTKTIHGNIAASWTIEAYNNREFYSAFHRLSTLNARHNAIFDKSKLENKAVRRALTYLEDVILERPLKEILLNIENIEIDAKAADFVGNIVRQKPIYHEVQDEIVTRIKDMWREIRQGRWLESEIARAKETLRRYRPTGKRIKYIEQSTENRFRDTSALARLNDF